MAKADLTAQRLRELLSYDPETGVFTRITRTCSRVRIGDEAGGVSVRGYRVISVLNAIRYGHQLAWLYVTGEWPGGEIDHINGVKTDNRWANLRIATRHTNMQNRVGAGRRSATNKLGVTIANKRFAARIYAGRKNLYLGTFDTAEEAHAAYVEAKRRLHPGNTL